MKHHKELANELTCLFCTSRSAILMDRLLMASEKLSLSISLNEPLCWISPLSYLNALTGGHFEGWLQTFQQKINSFHSNRYELVLFYSQPVAFQNHHVKLSEEDCHCC